MRKFMPGIHRRFLEHIAEIANIRAFVEERSDDQGLLAAYNACLEMMVSMRDVHIRIVARYILTQSFKNERQDLCSLCSCDKNSSTPQPESPSNAPAETRKGLGGTDLIPFLSRVRTGTKQLKMSSLATGTLDSREQQMSLKTRTGLQYILTFAIGMTALCLCKWSRV
jgi:indoleamine 2,3-dioxygenase